MYIPFLSAPPSPCLPSVLLQAGQVDDEQGDFITNNAAGIRGQATNGETGFSDYMHHRLRDGRGVTQGNEQCFSCVPAGRERAPQHTDITTGIKNSTDDQQRNTAQHDRPQEGKASTNNTAE